MTDFTDARSRGPMAATGSSALALAAERTLPVVRERRGTTIRDTEGVARRLTTTAIDLFVARGFDSVTVTEIATGAGVNRRTFFRYFPTKETVVLDIWNQTNASLVELIATSSASQNPVAVLADAVATWSAVYADLLTGLAEINENSNSLLSAVTSRLPMWEEAISAALVRRFPDFDSDMAEMAGVVAMGVMRVSRRRMLANRTTYPQEVAQLTDSLKVALS
jgi:AcrR family transcriptional regulator